MRGCLVVGAAPQPDSESFYAALAASHALVIAADAAAEWCMQLGRIPDLAVGDFDSAAQGAPERLRDAGVEVIVLPVDKDDSDLDCCVALARSRGHSSLTLTASYTGRMDHTLCAVGSLVRSGPGSRIEEPSWWAHVVDETSGVQVLDLPCGSTFTVLSPGGACGVTVSGARYPADEVDLAPLSSLGLSNVAIGSVSVAVRAGTVIITGER